MCRIPAISMLGAASIMLLLLVGEVHCSSLKRNPTKEDKRDLLIVGKGGGLAHFNSNYDPERRHKHSEQAVSRTVHVPPETNSWTVQPSYAPTHASILPSTSTPSLIFKVTPTVSPTTKPSPIEIERISVSIELSVAYVSLPQATFSTDRFVHVTNSEATAFDDHLGGILSDALTRMVTEHENGSAFINHRSVQMVAKQSAHVTFEGSPTVATWSSFRLCFLVSRNNRSETDNDTLSSSARAYDTMLSIFSVAGLTTCIDSIISQGDLLRILRLQEVRVIGLVRKGDEDYSIAGLDLLEAGKDGCDWSQIVGLLLFFFTVAVTVTLCISSCRRRREKDTSSSIVLSSEENVTDFLARSSLTLVKPSVYIEVPQHLLERHAIS